MPCRMLTCRHVWLAPPPVPAVQSRSSGVCWLRQKRKHPVCMYWPARVKVLTNCSTRTWCWRQQAKGCTWILVHGMTNSNHIPLWHFTSIPPVLCVAEFLLCEQTLYRQNFKYNHNNHQLFYDSIMHLLNSSDYQLRALIRNHEHESNHLFSS